VLSDVSPAALDAACCEATEIAEQFPKPSHIPAALKRFESVPRTRPDYLDEPVLPVNERWTEEERETSNRLREKLGLRPCPDDTAKTKPDDGNSQSE
jgi:hypothetical protein